MTRRRTVTLTDDELLGTPSQDTGVQTIPYSPPPTPEEMRKTAQLVAVRSTDAAECRRLLDMLGLGALVRAARKPGGARAGAPAPAHRRSVSPDETPEERWARLEREAMRDGIGT